MMLPFQKSVATLAAWSLICLSVIQANSSWVTPNDTTIINQEICEGECAIIGSTAFCEPGIYTEIFPGTNNCDSVVIITIDEIEKLHLDIMMCPGECTYIPEIDSTFCPETSGFFDFALGSCEEGLTVFVELGGLQTPILKTLICLGECVDLGPLITIDTLLCPTQDTIVFLPLNDLCMDSMEIRIFVGGPPSLDSLIFNICEGECLDFNGGTFCNNYSTTTTYSTSDGCDSTIYFELNVESTGSSVQLGICEGECIQWQGLELCSDTIIIDTTLTVNDCQQIHIISVEIIDLNTVLLPADTFIYLEGNLVFEIGLENFSVTWNNGEASSIFVFEGSEFGLGIHPVYATIVDNITGCTLNTDTTLVEVVLLDSNEELTPAPDIQIFPNPIQTGQALQIVLPEEFTQESFTISLHSITGSTIMQESMLAQLSNLEIELPNSLPSGIYLLNIQGRKNRWGKKLLIQ